MTVAHRRLAVPSFSVRDLGAGGCVIQTEKLLNETGKEPWPASRPAGAMDWYSLGYGRSDQGPM
jgi:hypothetical protein